MPSTANPRGFTPVRHMTGGEIRENLYKVDSSNATAIFPGDLVKLESDGRIAPAAADTGLTVIGVAVAVYDSNKRPIAAGYLAALTAGFIGVVDDPYIIYEVEADGSVAETDVGATANHVATAGDTTTGRSKHSLDASDIGTGAQLKILGLYDVSGNAFDDSFVRLEVLINEQHYKAAVAGV